MKQSLHELCALSQRFYPRGIQPDDPGYNETAEHRRLLAAQAASVAEVGRFRDMLARLAARFPECVVEDRLYAIPGLMNAWDTCYPAKLILPVPLPPSGEHALAFLVSIVAPCFMIHRIRFRHEQEQQEGTLRRGDRDAAADRSPDSFTFSTEEEPYAKAISAEIEATYGYERMPPEIGNQPVPDVSRRSCGRREATIYDCLFTDQIW